MIRILVIKMTSIGICSDTSEAVELLEAQGLYLKPVAKLNISVQLPQLKSPGSSISNWEVMEKLKKMIKPDTFLVLKVIFRAVLKKWVLKFTTVSNIRVSRVRVTLTVGLA